MLINNGVNGKTNTLHRNKILAAVYHLRPRYVFHAVQNVVPELHQISADDNKIHLKA